MPYEIKNGNCVHKVGDSKPLKCYDNHADALKYMHALMANVEEAKELNSSILEKAPNKADFAYTPDDVPSHWKLDITDDAHISAAIGALSSNPPHGQGVDIPSDAKAGVIKKIASAINSKISDPDKKAHLKDELSKVKSSDQFTLEQVQLLKQSTVFDQSQVGYTPLSATKGQACANCVFYRSTAFDGIEWPHCLIVENDDPNPIEPTGWCNHWEAKPEPAPDPMATMADTLETALESIGTSITGALTNMPTTEMQMEYKPKNWLQRAKEALFPSQPLSPFSIHKSGDRWYWVAAYTNAYEDKEHEIFTEKAHEDYIARVDMGLVDMPELWTWHVKGSKHGKADCIFGVGRMVVAVGHFDDTPAAKNAINFYQKNASRLKLSHGSIAPKWAIHDGLIESYNTFEISTLPNGNESNPYTSYEAVKAMQPDAKKLEFVAAALGKEKTEEIVNSLAQKSKELDDMQIRYKDFVEVVTPVTSAQDKDVQKNMSEVFVDMVKEQGEFVGLLKAMENRQTATDTLIKELTESVKKAADEAVELRKIVAAGPQRPTTNSATVVDQETVDKLKTNSANGNDKVTKDRQLMGLPPIAPTTNGKGGA